MAAPVAAPSPDEWRTQQAIVLRNADADVVRLLKQSQHDVIAQLKEVLNRPAGIGRNVREAQLNLIRRNLSLELGKVYRELGNVTEARRQEAAARAIKWAEQMDAFKLTAAGLPKAIAVAIADAEADAAKGALDRMIARTSGASYTPLSQRVYNSSTHVQGKIDSLVNSALARGLSAVEFAKEVRQYVNPLTPGGLRYSAMRLSRTEINNAAHAVAIDAQRGKPWVQGMKWNLSGSHGRPDICDQYAHGGVKGDGVYPVEQTPAKPHPHCFCWPTPEVDDEEDFLNNLVAGKYKNYLERYENFQPEQVIRATVKPTEPVKKRSPAPKPAKELTPQEQLVEKMLKSGQNPENVLKLVTPIFNSEKEARAFIARVVRDLPAPEVNWIGKLHLNLGGMGKNAEEAIAKSQEIVGSRINRLKSIEKHDVSVSPDGVNQVMSSAFACASQGKVYIAKDLLSRIENLKNCLAKGWFSPTSLNVNQITRTMAHEIGHTMTVGHMGRVEVSDWLGSLADHLDLPKPITPLGGLYPLQDKAAYKAWLNQRFTGPSGRTTTVRTVIEREFGKYAGTSAAELVAEIWAPYVLDATPTAAIRFGGDGLKKIITGA